MWKVVYSKQALKDSKKIVQSNLKDSVQKLLKVLENDPFQIPPPYERLIGDLIGKYSRRINIQHRLVYEVFEENNTVRVLRMWSHYE